jgi:hypothetical protein
LKLPPTFHKNQKQILLDSNFKRVIVYHRIGYRPPVLLVDALDLFQISSVFSIDGDEAGGYGKRFGGIDAIGGTSAVKIRLPQRIRHESASGRFAIVGSFTGVSG